jgi:ELWxxDGT repeat protein
LVLERLEDRLLPSGTPRLLKDINLGSASSNPSGFIAVGSETFFTADDGTHGRQLWKTDGTAAGTVMVTDITTSSVSDYVLTNVNGTIFFTSFDLAHGHELWASNGTAAGTVMLKEIASVSYPGALEQVNVNGTLFFNAADPGSAALLWRTNGTRAGTVLVKDVLPGQGGYSPGELTNVNGTLFFSAAEVGRYPVELWRSDGTEGGTTAVAPGAAGVLPTYLTNVNGTLFYSAHDGSLQPTVDLWQSNGTPAGTKITDRINLYRQSGAQPHEFVNVSGTLFFNADDGVNGYQLWRTNGTEAGTVRVEPLNSPSIAAGLPTNVNGTLFFFASGTNPFALWRSDGTDAGTNVVRSGAPEFSADFTNCNGILFCEAYEPLHGSQIWRSDGTAAGTLRVSDVNPGTTDAPRYVTAANGMLFFTQDDGSHGSEPWVIPSFNPTPVSVTSSPQPSAIGQGVTFTATVHGSGGTPTGTVNFGEGSKFLAVGVPLNSQGQAFFRTNALAVGGHTITAGYNGDSTFAPGSGNDASAPQIVRYSSDTTITSATAISVHGQVVTFTASVSAVAPASGLPTGMVVFLDTGTTLGSGSLAQGVATFSTSALAVGSHAISATYTGDADFLASPRSLAIGQTVKKAASRAVVISSLNPSVVGQTITLTAKVSAIPPGAGIPAGVVYFRDTFNGTTSTLGSEALDGSGKAVLIISTLVQGNHAVTAVYTGDGNFGGSMSLVFGQAVHGASTALLPSSASLVSLDVAAPHGFAVVSGSSTDPLNMSPSLVILVAARLDTFFVTSFSQRPGATAGSHKVKALAHSEDWLDRPL